MTDKSVKCVTQTDPTTQTLRIDVVQSKEEEAKLTPELEYAQTFLSDQEQKTKVRDGILYCWNGSFWESMFHRAAEHAARWLSINRPKSAKTNIVHSAVAFTIMRLPRLPKTTTDTVIPVENGYLSVSKAGDITLLPADKEAGLTYCVPCMYEENATAPKFMAFIESVLPDPAVRNLVQEYAGYTLLPDTRYQVAQLWIGKGRNGKGTLAQILGALHRKVAAMSIDTLSGFAVEGLIDATLVHVDEVPRRIDEQRLKIAISGDPLLVDRKYQSALTIRPTAKWIVLTNEIPSLSDQSDGLWRRFHIVPFSVQIPEEEVNPLLARQVIEDELAGVLNWAIEGLARLLSRGQFPRGIEAVERAKQQAKMETDSVLSWVENTGPEFNHKCRTLKEDVYEAYQKWCKESGVGAVALGKFWRRLRDKNPEIVETRSRREGSRVRYVNIKLHNIREEVYADRGEEKHEEETQNSPPNRSLEEIPF